MRIVELLTYLLAGAPFLASRLVAGRAPPTGAELAADAALAAIILALALLTRRARLAAARIDSLRKTMNEAIIHDLKNPMTSIMGCLSYLQQDKPDSAAREKMLSLALHGCRAQMTLLETLVDTNRLEQGELAPQKSPMDVRLLLEDCLDGVRGAAVQIGVNLEEKLSARLPKSLCVDPDLFPRVLLNLLHNALKYTGPGGTVCMSAAPAGAGIRFQVRDTGLGIAPENISRLFKKYYRVEGADQTSRRGSGLGLYFCRLVVEAHGGTISVSSDVGRGTSIAFDIPDPAPDRSVTLCDKPKIQKTPSTSTRGKTPARPARVRA